MLAWIIFFALFAIADKQKSLKIQQDTTKTDGWVNIDTLGAKDTMTTIELADHNYRVLCKMIGTERNTTRIKVSMGTPIYGYIPQNKAKKDTTKIDTAKVEITQSILMQQMKKHNEKIDSLIQKKTKK